MGISSPSRFFRPGERRTSRAARMVSGARPPTLAVGAVLTVPGPDAYCCRMSYIIAMPWNWLSIAGESPVSA